MPALRSFRAKDGLAACSRFIGVGRAFCLNPNSEAGMGSARVPRASSGVAPELSSHTLPGISRREKFVGRCFRRDAENHTPEACAPQNTPLCPFSISEFGLKAEIGRAHV